MTQSASLEFGISFQGPTGDAYLGDPYSMHFSPDGSYLYVADRYPSKIHQWRADGTYMGAFAGKGEGPGELNRPLKITAHNDLVWVWDAGQRFSCFKSDGSFVRSFKLPGVEPRNFACLDGNRFLIAHKKFLTPTDQRRLFQIIDDKGMILKTLKEIKVAAAASNEGGQIRAILRGFGPEADVQRDSEENLLFGFSHTSTLERIDSSGTPVGQLKFDLPAQPLSDADKEFYRNLTFANPRDGGRIAFKDMPGISFDFSKPKAYYTQFMIVKDKVVFVLHALGGLNGAGHGFRQGHFSVNQINGGQRVAAGRFDFPEDSAVLMRDGRALAILSQEEGYVIKEVFFQGTR